MSAELTPILRGRTVHKQLVSHSAVVCTIDAGGITTFFNRAHKNWAGVVAKAGVEPAWNPV